MTVIDIIVLVIIGISVVYGVFRGLVREVLALLAWFASFLLANLRTPRSSCRKPWRARRSGCW
jgi:membrane protein required for colicin V production